MKTLILFLLLTGAFPGNGLADVDAYIESSMAFMRRQMTGPAEIRAEEYRLRHLYCDEHHNCWLDSDKEKMDAMKEKEKRAEVERIQAMFPHPFLG